MTKSNKKLTLNVTGIGASQMARAAFPEQHHMVLIPGYGDEDYKFPEVDDLVIHALERLTGATVEVADEQPSHGEGDDAPITLPFKHRNAGSGNKVGKPALKLIEVNAPPVTGDETAGHGSLVNAESHLDQTFAVGAEGIRLILQRSCFAPIKAERFDPLKSRMTSETCSA